MLASWNFRIKASKSLIEAIKQSLALYIKPYFVVDYSGGFVRGRDFDFGQAYVLGSTNHSSCPAIHADEVSQIKWRLTHLNFPITCLVLQVLHHQSRLMLRRVAPLVHPDRITDIILGREANRLLAELAIIESLFIFPFT